MECMKVVNNIFGDMGIFIIGFLWSGAEQKCNARKSRAAVGGEDSWAMTLYLIRLGFRLG